MLRHVGTQFRHQTLTAETDRGNHSYQPFRRGLQFHGAALRQLHFRQHPATAVKIELADFRQLLTPRRAVQ
ncbi:hypothetical protein D3C73_1624420 [compost metagenome]